MEIAARQWQWGSPVYRAKLDAKYVLIPGWNAAKRKAKADAAEDGHE